MKRPVLFGVALMAALGLGAWLGTASASIRLVPIYGGLSSPVLLTSARDGSDRRFIVEQGGVIKVLQPGSTVPTVFLNITTKVLSGGEQGLLGLAFHPQYLTNRRFFVYYTRQTDGANTVAEYHASVGDPNVADTAETVLFAIPDPFANHNGGMIGFGPDGFLYIGTGDGGSGNDPGNRSQNINNLPIVIAGGAGGTLKQGVAVNVEGTAIGPGNSERFCAVPGDSINGSTGSTGGNVPINKLYVTVLNALGCKAPGGGPVTTFGQLDSAVPEAGITNPGELSDLKA